MIKLKSLVELVEEYKDLFFNQGGDLERAGASPTCRLRSEYLVHLGGNIEDGKDRYIPTWAIKKPEQKKLFAYCLEKDTSVVVFSKIDVPRLECPEVDDRSDFVRDREFDLTFGEGE